MAGLAAAAAVVGAPARAVEMSSDHVHGFVRVAGRPSSSHDSS